MAKKTNFQIAFELGAKMDPSMKKNFNDANKRLSGFGKKVGSLVKTGAKMAVGMGAAFVGVSTAAFAMTNKVTSALDKIATSSDKLGVSTDFYQEMDYWASQNGLSHEDMEKSVGRFNQRLGLAQNGNKKYANALDQMGVSLEDVKNGTLSTEDAFAQSIKHLSEMENEHDKVALATDLFGTKLSRNLLPALQDGSMSIEEAKEKAEELGIVVSEDSIEAASKFQDSWDDLTRTFQIFGQKAITKLIPHFQKILDWTLSNMPIIQEKITNAFDRAGEIMGTAFEKAKPVMDWIASDGIPMAKEAIEGIIETAQKFYEYISNNWSTIKPILIGVGTAALILKSSILALSVIQSVTSFIKVFQATTVAGRLAMLGLNGAMLANPAFWIIAAFMALIAVGIAVWKNWDTISEFLIGVWEKIKDTAVAVFYWLIEFFSEWGLTILTVLSGPIGWLVALIIQNWDLIREYTMIVTTAIVDFFVGAYNWVTGVFSGIGSWFAEKFAQVQDAAASVGEWISEKFQAAYNAVTGLFSGLGEWFGGIMSNVTGAFAVGINAIIGLANGAINKINSISVDIPDWVPGGLGGKSFGLNIPNIPYLAEGGVTTGATLAMIGEGAEQEAVLPLSKLQALLDMPKEQSAPQRESDIKFVYSPKVIVQGNADETVIRKAIKMDYNEFKRFMDKYNRDRNRKKL